MPGVAPPHRGGCASSRCQTAVRRPDTSLDQRATVPLPLVIGSQWPTATRVVLAARQEMHAPGTPACPVTSPRSIREASSSPAPPGWVDATAPRATLPRVNQRHARDAHLARRYEQRLRRPSSSARWLEDPVPLRTGSAAVLSHALITTHASEEAGSSGSELAAKSGIKRRSTTSGKRRGTTSRQVARSRLLIWRAGGGGGRQRKGRVTEIRAECRVVADGGRAVDVHVEHGY